MRLCRRALCRRALCGRLVASITLAIPRYSGNEQHNPCHPAWLLTCASLSLEATPGPEGLAHILPDRNSHPDRGPRSRPGRWTPPGRVTEGRSGTSVRVRRERTHHAYPPGAQITLPERPHHRWSRRGRVPGRPYSVRPGSAGRIVPHRFQESRSLPIANMAKQPNTSESCTAWRLPRRARPRLSPALTR